MRMGICSIGRAIIAGMALSASTSGGAVPAFKHVMIVVFENQDAGKTRKQPFFAKLSAEGAYLSNFHAETHPSQPNYIALTSGGTHGVRGDGTVDVDATHIGDLLEQHGKTWRVYAEDYPGDCFTGSASGAYARKHNPFISYVNVNTNPDRCANIVNADQLAADIKNGTLPDYAFFVPNMDDDAHDTDLSYANDWYERAFGPLISDPRFMDGMLLITTFDESTLFGGNVIYTSLYGDHIKPGSTLTDRFDHYSLLRTIEDGLGIGTLGAQDTSARPIEGIWTSP